MQDDLATEFGRVEANFAKASRQATLLDERIRESYARLAHGSAHAQALRMRILTLEGVRYMYVKYVQKQTAALRKMAAARKMAAGAVDGESARA